MVFAIFLLCETTKIGSIDWICSTRRSEYPRLFSLTRSPSLSPGESEGFKVGGIFGRLQDLKQTCVMGGSDLRVFVLSVKSFSGLWEGMRI